MRAPWLLLPAALGLGCYTNPLLQSVTSDYAPSKSGSQWVYVVHGPLVDIGMTRTLLDRGAYFGRQADHYGRTYTSLLPAQDEYLASGSATALDQYSASQAKWIPYRRLPYVSGNRWPLDSTTPNVSFEMRVEGFENVRVPAGSFDNCYKLKVISNTYDPATGVTSTADSSLTWAAPSVGDVKGASVGLSGTVTVTLELTSYKLAP